MEWRVGVAEDTGAAPPLRLSLIIQYPAGDGVTILIRDDLSRPSRAVRPGCPQIRWPTP